MGEWMKALLYVEKVPGGEEEEVKPSTMARLLVGEAVQCHLAYGLHSVGVEESYGDEHLQERGPY